MEKSLEYDIGPPAAATNRCSGRRVSANGGGGIFGPPAAKDGTVSKAAFARRGGDAGTAYVRGDAIVAATAFRLAIGCLLGAVAFGVFRLWLFLMKSATAPSASGAPNTAHTGNTITMATQSINS